MMFQFHSTGSSLVSLQCFSLISSSGLVLCVSLLVTRSADPEPPVSLIKLVLGLLSEQFVLWTVLPVGASADPVAAVLSACVSG